MTFILKVNPCHLNPCSYNQSCLRLGSLGYTCHDNGK